MKKSYLILAAAAIFAACSSDDGFTESQNVVQTADDGSVQFEAYVNRGTTRAGAPGTLTTDGTGTDATLASLNTKGFGVFGYYTDGEPYSENAKPNFFYNQKVYFDSDWKYTPVKYWPNEFGPNAISEGQDKLTFFAYAPYVDVNLTTGIAEVGSGESETGIIALTRNTSHGDPFVKYYASFDPETRVDLCWGVSKDGLSSSVDDAKAHNAIAVGKQYIDVSKPKVGDKIGFEFKHALAALKVTVDADVDVPSHNDGSLDNYTKIWVRSVTFNGFTDKGMLNLNADDSKPLWYDLSGINLIGSGGSVTIYDGRSDGKEGQTNADASNETPNDLNAKIVQNAPYVKSELTTNERLFIDAAHPGVTHTQVNLFNSDNTDPIYVIPTNDDLSVTIVYDVETYDPNLPTYLSDGVTRGSTIQNAITKDIKISGAAFKLAAGKQYSIALHLGMTSVKFEAEVTPWADGGTADNTDLPINAPASFSATAPAAQSAAAHTAFPVAVKDASDAAVDMSTPGDFTFVTTYSDNNGNNNVAYDLNATGTASGFTVDLPALTDFYGRVYKVVVTKDATGEKQIVEITQNAPVLNETITAAYTSGTKTISLTPTTLTMTPTISTPWSWSNITVTDGSGDPVSVTNNEDGTLTTASALGAGDYTITIINGDVTTVVSLNVP